MEWVEWVDIRQVWVTDEIGPLETYTEVRTSDVYRKESPGLAERVYGLIYPYISIKPSLGNGRQAPICESWGFKIVFATPRYRFACPEIFLDLGVAGKVRGCLYDVPEDVWKEFWAVLGISGCEGGEKI